MIRGLSYKLKRIRPHTLFLLVLIGLVIYCIQLPDSLAEHPTRDAGHHRALLVTTPSNTSYPLHYIPLDLAPGHALAAQPVSIALPPDTRQSISHILHHHGRSDLFYVNNEVKPGAIFTGKLTNKGEKNELRLDLEGQIPSQGDLPAHTIITRDGKRLLAVNFDSSTISLFSISPEYQLALQQAVTLPRPAWVDSEAIGHPHHIIQHPRDSRTFYVPDVGYDVVYVLRETRGRVKTSLSVVQTFDTKRYGQGSRNGAVSPDGRTYFLSFQTSSSVIALNLDRHNLLLDTRINPFHTLPPRAIDEGLTAPDGSTIHLSSDILLHGDTLLVANRRRKGPYTPDTPKDTIAMFRVEKGRLQPNGHIQTGCWKPREMTEIRRPQGDLLAVTCTGAEGHGAGVLLFDPADAYRKVGKWDSGDMGVSGLVGVNVNI